MFDLIVSGGRVLDGSGSQERIADIGIRDGRIAAVEPTLNAEGAQVIDARDRVVTPGFVDIHAHYDGQMTWDDLLEPSSSHGVTTVVTGNCGVGFAPVRPDRHEALIELMEGVEDIPGAALSEGITWQWESFPEYLDALSGRHWSMDVATQLSHGPLRSYVRGDRADDEAASPDELLKMARLVREAIEAGAYGLSTSRTLGHRSVDGSPVPGTSADADELLALGEAVASAGGGIFEVAVSGLARSDRNEVTDGELDWIGRVAAETGLTTTFILLQVHNAPDRWRLQMDAASAWRAKGAHVVPLIAGRPFATLWGWDVRHPFLARPSYRELAGLPLPARLEQLRQSNVRDRILTEPDACLNVGEERQLAYLRKILPECFPMTESPDYEPPADRALAALAEQRGAELEEVAYDELLHDDAMLFYPLYNYAARDHDALYEQLLDTDAVVGLNDGGAHCAYICDASIPTYMLTHWSRDRLRGPRLPLSESVRRLTSQPAALYGLSDRGRIAPGLRADLNVIDIDGLRLAMPRAVSDLPAGGTRLLQSADGYDATIVAGEVTRRHGVDTGARPGRLLRRS